MIGCLGRPLSCRSGSGRGLAESGQPPAEQGIGPAHGLGGCRVGDDRRRLFLPEIEIAACELFEIRRVRHGKSIAAAPPVDQRQPGASSANRGQRATQRRAGGTDIAPARRAPNDMGEGEGRRGEKVGGPVFRDGQPARVARMERKRDRGDKFSDEISHGTSLGTGTGTVIMLQGIINLEISVTVPGGRSEGIESQ